jgi:nitroreductase
MEFTDLLSLRRSTRKYEAGDISDEDIRAILEAAESVPVGSALFQDVHITVLRDKELMKKLARASEQRIFDKKKMSEAFDRAKGMDPNNFAGESGYDPFYGSGTAFIVSHRRQTAQPGIEYANAAIAAYTMHLAATNRGLGSVLLWFVLETVRLRPELTFEKALQLPEDFVPLLGVTVGIPQEPLSARAIHTDRIQTTFV